MKRLLSILSIWAFTGVVSGAAEPDLLFQSADPFDITLTAPFTLIDRERDSELEYDGTLSYTDDSGEPILLDVTLSVRGNWRLQKGNCRYSQLWVNLKRGQVPGTIFENQNRLKLVVQCDRSDKYASYIVKEEMLYQIFRELSEYNFDTRMVNATYVDSERDNSSRTHLAFFIEHQNRMAERFGMDEVELERISLNQLDPAQANLVALFMYLAGNTDYSAVSGEPGDECCHNTKLLVNDAGKYFSIPYDFDGSGFVNATYAAPPNPLTGVSSNRRRAYRGYCAYIEAINDAVAVMKAAQESTNAIIGDRSQLSNREANQITRYMEDFYEILEDSRQLERRIIRNCLG